MVGSVQNGLVLPALLAWQMFVLFGRLPMLKRQWFTIGLLIGSSTALATVVLNSLVLAWGGQEDWLVLAQLVLLAHLPIVAIEGIIVGFTIRFLAQVKPEMLGLVLREKRECPVESLP